MSMLIGQLLTGRLGYSLLETTPERVVYVSERELMACLQTRKNEKRGMSLVGKKREQETGFFFLNAWVLGSLAQELEAAEGDTGIAVLFRDSDGTNATPDGHWAAKWRSMEGGFVRSGFERGVPMLPRPTSEAWLLCGTDTSNCAVWEALPGNQASPNHPKKKLAAFFGRDANDPLPAVALCEWLQRRPYDVDRAAGMESFRCFRDRFDQVLDAVLS